MIFITKSFPKLKNIFIFLLVILFSCSADQPQALDNEKFIEIYARLLIISKMDISKEYQDRLITEMYRDFNISAADIDSSVAYLNAHPENWVEILEKTRDKIQKIRTETTPEDKIPAEIENNPALPNLQNMDKSNIEKRPTRKKPGSDKPHPLKPKKDTRN